MRRHSAWADGAIGRPPGGWPASVGIRHGGPDARFTQPPAKDAKWPADDGGWSVIVQGYRYCFGSREWKRAGKGAGHMRVPDNPHFLLSNADFKGALLVV